MDVARVLCLLLLGGAGVVRAGQFVFPRWHNHHQHQEETTTPEPRQILQARGKYPSFIQPPHKEIPLSLIKKLNEVDNVHDFINNFVNKSTVSEGFLIADRFGETEERKSVQMAKQATCKPELTVVPLNTSLDPRLYSWPTCTRIERCGGCCQHKLLNCQATEFDTVNFQVMVIEYTGEDFLAQRRKEIIALERHLKCKCDCIVKESHCNSIQKYDSDECACICTNVDEEEKCKRDNDTKYWDSRACNCKCLQVRECSTGYDFDHNTCSCQQLNIRRRRIGENGPEKAERFNRITQFIPPFIPSSGDS